VISKSGQCGVKNASVGVCAPASSICVDTDGICPDGWSGFSCSGDASPEGAAGDFCGQVHADSTTGPVVPGLWCCGNGIRQQDNPRLIDDMSSGPLIKLQPMKGYLPGGWFTFSDDGNALISPAPTALFSYRTIEPAVTPAAEAAPISHAACLRSDGINGYVAGEGFDFLRDPKDHFSVPLNVSRYTGIRFWAYSAPPAPGKLDLPTQIRVEFPNTDTWELSPKSTCILEGEACDYFGEVLTLPNDGSWTQYTVKWDDLEQQGYGKSYEPFKANLYTVNFDFQGPGLRAGTRSLPFDFCVAQIEFTED
jgi:hypothetical protein